MAIIDEQKKTKCALVTGGSRGIGQGIAMALAEAGYELAIVHFRDGERAENTASSIRDQWGVRCTVIEADLRELSAASAVVEEAIRAIGRIDVLINNAGITLLDSIQELDLTRLDDLLALNFRAPIVLMHEVSKHMIALGIQGSIVNITSGRAVRAFPGDAVYGGLKAGLQRATESAALDLAPYGIRVNCIAPGAIRVREEDDLRGEFSKAIPLGRMGLPDDIGRAAAWLVSEGASYATGMTMKIDGGLTLPSMPEDGGSDWGARKT